MYINFDIILHALQVADLTAFAILGVFDQSFSRLDSSHSFADSVLILYSLLWKEVEAEYPFLTTLSIGELMQPVEQFRVLDSLQGIYKYNQEQVTRIVQQQL